MAPQLPRPEELLAEAEMALLRGSVPRCLAQRFAEAVEALCSSGSLGEAKCRMLRMTAEALLRAASRP